MCPDCEDFADFFSLQLYGIRTRPASGFLAAFWISLKTVTELIVSPEDIVFVHIPSRIVFQRDNVVHMAYLSTFLARFRAKRVTLPITKLTFQGTNATPIMLKAFLSAYVSPA